MTARTTRLMWIGIVGSVLSLAVGLSVFAMRAGISYAMSPSELREAAPPAGQRIRLFGLVEEGSVMRGDGLQVSFALTDTSNRVAVSFADILPDLFRENQGIITEGVLRPDGVFAADEVLAKHDENYMPADMAEKLKAEGVWQGNAGGAARP